jgi:hypothetical protein
VATIERRAVEGFPGVAELLARCEDKLGLLYRIYADRFPRYRDFWTSLSMEKSELARLFRQLDQTVRSGKALINTYALNVAMVVSLYNYITEMITKAEQDPLTPINAVSIAMNIERSTLKTKHLEYLTVPSPETKDFIRHLLANTLAHREKIQTHWESIRFAHD